MLPGRCEWLPTAPVYGICVHECVTMCMCVSTGANLDGLKAEDKFRVYACMHDNKSDLNLNLEPGRTQHLCITYDLYIDGMKMFPVDIQIHHVIALL